MKAFLAPKIRKSIPEKLAFAKIDFLGLAQFFNFLVLDRFLLPPSVPSVSPASLVSTILLVLPIVPSTFYFSA